MSAVVELRAVHKRYGDVHALRGVDLAIHPGEVVALLGPNGAGKTTAVSLMLGLRRPTSGRALLFGMEPTGRRARSRCGVVLQESGIPGVLTVREIVDLFRSYYPAPLPATQVIAMAGLEDKARSRTATLSGGQRQRLYWALAICGDPEMLFLDEPTVGMDVEARQSFRRQVQAFATSGKTLVLTTHYLEDAEQLAQRILVIDHGVIVADAAPHDLKAAVPAKRVNFRTADPVTAETFARLPVHSVVLGNHQVHLLSNEPEVVLRELFARGVRMAELEVLSVSLEDALLSLTSRTAT